MVAIITERETDVTLVFMKLNKRPQEEIDQYLKDQEDIVKILQDEGSKTYSELREKLGDRDISSPLSYLVKSDKISFTINSDGSVNYWDWSDY